MLTAQELKSSPLFHDISYEEYRRMLTCFQAAQRSYVPEEQVYDFASSRTDAVGIVERGQVSLIRIDEAGVATVLEDMGPGGVFGRHLAFAGFAADSLEVVARTACDILFIDNSCIFKRCENACTHHSTLVYNMMNLLSNKTRSSASGWTSCPGGPSGKNCCAISASRRRRAGRMCLRCPFL